MRLYVRDHLLEPLQHALDVGARGDIVLDPVDEGGVGYAARVGGGVFVSVDTVVNTASKSR